MTMSDKPHRYTPHRYALRVQWEDTDAAGIVYYANYLRFIERGRSDLLLQNGIDQRELIDAENGVAFVVRSCHIDYLKPARLHEILVVTTALTELLRSCGEDAAVALVDRMRERIVGGELTPEIRRH